MKQSEREPILVPDEKDAERVCTPDPHVMDKNDDSQSARSISRFPKYGASTCPARRFECGSTVWAAPLLVTPCAAESGVQKLKPGNVDAAYRVS